MNLMMVVKDEKKYLLQHSAYRSPAPIRYVFVPCKVIGPGLHPNIRIRLALNLVIIGIGVSFAAHIVMFVNLKINKKNSL